MTTLGVIGLSEGNGHPYSWSAIINGDYDARVMADCGFPVIPQYLAANRDTLGIPGARVTHVWTQDAKISRGIAAASKIEHVADRLEDLIGAVDAVLLSRDDPETHVQFARPFLDAGVPLFIDKPLAFNDADLDYFVRQHEAGKFFMSCSSMRYASEHAPAKADFPSLGPIELVTAVGKKDWPKYGVHMLEAAFALLGDPMPVAVRNSGRPHRDIVTVEFESGVQASVHLFYDIAPTFQASIFGRNAWRQVEYKNWYAMFRANIVAFVESVRSGQPAIPFEKTRNIIRTLIAADKSRNQGGTAIQL